LHMPPVALSDADAMPLKLREQHTRHKRYKHWACRWAQRLASPTPTTPESVRGRQIEILA